MDYDFMYNKKKAPDSEDFRSLTQKQALQFSQINNAKKAMFSEKKALSGSPLINDKEGGIDVKEFYTREKNDRINQKKLSSVQEFKNEQLEE